MHLLLTSMLHPRMEEVLSGTVVYIADAARTLLASPGGRKHAEWEHDQVRLYGCDLVDVMVATTPPDQLVEVLDHADGIYMASGETFDLLNALKTSGADKLIVDKVREGLPYVGSSAGSVVAGPSIEPISVMDSPDLAPNLHDYTALDLIDRVIIPHAQGDGAYPATIITETVERYGSAYPLLLLEDGQALEVDGTRQSVIA
ncbi:Type 1 glutamine amidotransferase-like domain-containing protein [Bifidobacterium bombi]|uniref:Peptidase E n=1 Tax=Bifidobacterium bombi DSM 19703 TaxID=1341695 RepID=A0A080N3Y5_9BIFI|nr:Type 1 glutamine amidotransferase-like domain-containing protein [Bifidobacterium bombi]KFF30895.1 peptidase E [Bifidobacterium bombi DSM 19703]